MAWVKLDDQARHHRKVLAAGPIAAWMWVCGLMYCNSQKARDGFIPEEAVPVLYPIAGWRREAARLVSIGLWERVPGGYRVHDYHDYQPTVDDAAALAEKRASAGRAGGLAKAGAKRKQPPSNLLANDQQPASNSLATDAGKILARPDPVPIPEDPPQPPKGASTESRVPIPPGVVQLERVDWIDAYVAGVEVVAPGFTFRPQTFSALERVVQKRAPVDHRPRLPAWIEREAERFARAVRAKASVWSGYSPDGFERWWNAGCPTEGPAAAPRFDATVSAGTVTPPNKSRDLAPPAAPAEKDRLPLETLLSRQRGGATGMCTPIVPSGGGAQ